MTILSLYGGPEVKSSSEDMPPIRVRIFCFGGN